MPPRKRLRVSQPASPIPTAHVKTPTPAEESSPPGDQLLNDPWTDEEETALFRALMRCKPTGIHKHFHLVALHQELLSSGHIHPHNEHTRPAGIWRKLEGLYDLSILNEREDARQLETVKIPSAFRENNGEESEVESGSGGEDADVYSEAANKIENEEFTLPGRDFEERKWVQRLANADQRRDESPPLFPDLNMAYEPPVRFTPSFSIEPSEAATPISRRGRARAGTASGRATAAASTRRSTRQAESVADEEGEQGEEEDAEEGEHDEETSEEEEESEHSTPARRGTRKTKETRARAEPKTRTRARGRAK